MLYLTGDTHGEKNSFKRAEAAGIKKGDTLIVCGDFGFIWDSSKKEQQTLKWIAKRKYQILFVDGFHDNHALLETYPIVPFAAGRARQIAENLYCLLRGELYQLEGKKVFAFGGGDSAHEESEKTDGDQFLPSSEEMDNGRISLANAGFKVDLIVTHDVPARIKTFIRPEQGELTQLHTFLEEVCQKTAFKQWFSGKYHQNKRIPPCYHLLFTDVVKFEE